MPPLRPPHPPPILARWLLRLSLSPEEHESLIGDLEEQYGQIHSAYGQAAANRRYWREALTASGLLAAHTTTPDVDRKRDSHMRRWLLDIRYAMRSLRRAPTHTMVCVLTLATALGGMAAVVSVVRPLLLDPVPYANANRLSMLWQLGTDGSPSNVGFTTVDDLKRTLSTVDAVAAIATWRPTLTFRDDAERVNGMRVSAEYFGALGVRPAIGRDFVIEEDVPDSRVVILSDGLWKRRYGGDSGIVGTSIDIAGTMHMVAGVLPASYDDVVWPTTQIWRVLGYSTAQMWACRTCQHLRMLVRTRAGVTDNQAAAEAITAMTRLYEQYPGEYSAPGAELTPLKEVVAGDTRPILLAISGAMLMVLLVAVVNVTHLQFARAIRRESEFAIRAALGASRLQMIRQMLAEAIVIVLIAAPLGMLIALVATPVLVSNLPATMPRLSAVSVDGGSLATLTVVATLVMLAIGILPVWRSGKATLADRLRNGQRTATGAHRAARASLVIVEVALALILMVGAGVLGRSLVQLYDVDMGFDASNTMTMEIQATGPRYAEDAAVHAHLEEVLRQVRALPGVLHVGTTNQLPLGGNRDSYGINALDRPLANPELAPSADRYTVSPEFADAMRIRVIDGRSLEENDNRSSTQPVAVVSEALAARIWPGERAIGKQIRVGGNADAPWREVVGVAANVRHDGLDTERTLQVYVPPRQWNFADNVVTLVVRTAGNPLDIQQAIVDAVRRVDPTQPIMKIATMDAVVARSTGSRRLAMVLFSTFAILAAVLAGAGLYGMLAGDVTQRTREIGIRVALGARPAQVIALIVRQAGGLLLVGGVVGVAGAMAFGRYLEALLFGVRPMDTATLLGVAGALLMVGIVAAMVPTMRALRVAPSVALRSE